MDFFQDVVAVGSHLPEAAQDEYVLICCQNAYLFAVAFFAAVSFGRIAVLAESKTLPECYKNIDMKFIWDNAAILAMTADGGEVDFSPDDPERPALVVCSSGTNSFKKGVVLSQRNVCDNLIGSMENYLFPRGARYVHVIPFAHMFGIVADLLCPLNSGGTICIPENSMSFFNSLSYFKPDCLNLPPLLLYGVLQMIKNYGYESATGGNLKKILCSGAPYDQEINSLFIPHNVRVYSAYGLTECSPCVAISCDEFFKKNSVGMIIGCNEVKISDGEVLIRGSNVMIGYHNDLEATKTALKDGWLHTGDMGTLDEDGFLYIEGRKDNLIIFSDGTKLVPEELERRLSQYTLIRECQVVGVYRNGSTQLAVLIVCDNPKALQSQVKQLVSDACHDLTKNICDTIICTDLPFERTALGKIRRIKENELSRIFGCSTEIHGD